MVYRGARQQDLGQGGAGGAGAQAHPPYRPYLWVIILTHLAQQKLQSQTAPRPIPLAPSGQHRRHMGGSHPTSRMSTSSQSRGPTAPRGMNAFSVLFDFHMNVSISLKRKMSVLCPLGLRIIKLEMSV